MEDLVGCQDSDQYAVEHPDAKAYRESQRIDGKHAVGIFGDRVFHCESDRVGDDSEPAFPVAGIGV
jgi:hypothetical protein